MINPSALYSVCYHSGEFLLASSSWPSSQCVYPRISSHCSLMIHFDHMNTHFSKSCHISGFLWISPAPLFFWWLMGVADHQTNDQECTRKSSDIFSWYYVARGCPPNSISSYICKQNNRKPLLIIYNRNNSPDSRAWENDPGIITTDIKTLSGNINRIIPPLAVL